MTEAIPPIIVNVGKKRRKAIKSLERGEGKLMDEVSQVISEVRSSLGASEEGKELVPIVIIYQKKTRRRRRPWGTSSV